MRFDDAMRTEDLCQLAADLATEHGMGAIPAAHQTMISLEIAGDMERAQVWQSLSVLLDDILCRRLDPAAPVVIH